MSFPFALKEADLHEEDFHRLASRFSHTVLELIPYARGPVSFLLPPFENSPGAKGLVEKKDLEQVLLRNRPVVSAATQRLLLPLSNGDASLCGVVLVDGADPQFAADLSGQWLSDRSRLVSRELRLLKEHLIDPVTGLFNASHLRDSLTRLPADGSQPVTLALLEISSRGRDAEKTLRYIARIGGYLDSYFGHSLLHHLGYGVFGLVLHGIDEEQAHQEGNRVLAWLKRERFHRAHLGYVTFSGRDAGNDRATPSPEDLLDQAWRALKTAGQRGPFAQHSHGVNQDSSHPLAPPDKTALGELRRLWRAEKKFSLLLVKQDVDGGFSSRILSLVGNDARIVTLNSSEAFIYLAGADTDKARAWGKNFSAKAKKATGKTFSLGIAGYPFHRFSKSDMAQNARKALLHTAFFGPGTMTVFDGVSLNISGDIYYGEGNLVRAVKEYRLGLSFDPDNVNLLNSLGEACAQMNHHRQAVSCFERALAIDPDNYMALFNLGVAHQLTGDELMATAALEKALQVNRKQASEEHNFDLHLLLGRLYFQAREFARAIEHLEVCRKLCDAGGPAVAEGKRRAGRSLVLRYLGEAHKELGQPREAMTFLQRAMGYNPRDPGAMSLLGELYAVEKQGDDIALSLCRQAVEIDDGPWEHWYRLGLVQYQRGEFLPAQHSLRQSLLRNRRAVLARLLLAKTYEQTGQTKSAVRVYEKLVDHADFRREAEAGLVRLRKKSA